MMSGHPLESLYIRDLLTLFKGQMQAYIYFLNFLFMCIDNNNDHFYQVKEIMLISNHVELAVF